MHTHTQPPSPAFTCGFFVFKDLSVKTELPFCEKACLFYTGTYSNPPATIINTWLFPVVFYGKGGGGHQWNRDVEAARGIFIFVFVFSQGSPKYIEFLAWSQLLKLFLRDSILFWVSSPSHSSKVAKKRDSKEKVTLPLESKYLSSWVNGDMFVWLFSPIRAS